MKIKYNEKKTNATASLIWVRLNFVKGEVRSGINLILIEAEQKERTKPVQVKRTKF